MRSHEEAHRDDFQDHLQGVDQQEHKINGHIVSGNTIYLLVECQEKAVNHNNKKDESIEPGVDGHQLNDFVPEGVCNRQTAQGNSRVILLLICRVGQVVIVRVGGHCFLHGLHRLDAELTKGEPSDLIIKW